MAKKDKTAQFRVDTEEKAHLKKAAADAGMGFSDYMRALTLDPTVLVVGGRQIVIVPSTQTSAAEDEAINSFFEEILLAVEARRQGEEASPAPVAAAEGDPPSSPQPPPGASMPPAAPAAPAPDSPPAVPTSPGGDGEMVGSSEPEPAAPAPAAGAAPGGDAGGEGVATDAPDAERRPSSAGASPAPPSTSERCPGCGGTEGRHQPWCVEVTGVPPGAQPAPGPEPPSEKEVYLERRINEGENRLVAEAEWSAGQLHPPAAPADPEAGQVPCPTCGTKKLPEAQCPQCGRRPG